MSSLLFGILIVAPCILLVLSVVMALRHVKNGGSRKSAIVRQLCMFLALGVVFCLFAAAASAAPEGSSDDDTTATVEAEEKSDASISAGMGYLAAALVTGLSGIGGGIAVAAGAPAAIGATSEDPKAFGKALIFVALGEGIALYGLLVSILILSKV